MFKLFKKRVPDDVDNKIMGKETLLTKPPKDFDYEKAWREGFVMTVDVERNPQEYADINQNIYEHNNKILSYICIVCIVIIAIITSATHLAFLNIKEPKFFTTTPSGHIQKINSKSNPYKLSRIPNDKHVAEMTNEYFKENMDKIKWFDGKKPDKLNLTYAFQSEGSENNKAIEIDNNGGIKKENTNAVNNPTLQNVQQNNIQDKGQ